MRVIFAFDGDRLDDVLVVVQQPGDQARAAAFVEQIGPRIAAMRPRKSSVVYPVNFDRPVEAERQLLTVKAVLETSIAVREVSETLAEICP